jgi:hypothetical protein
MGSIRIEELGDIQSTYNLLEVFQEGATNAFLLITATEAKELRFTFYPIAEGVSLSQADWERILTVAKDFMPRTIASEEAFERWSQEQDLRGGDESSQ